MTDELDLRYEASASHPLSVSPIGWARTGFPDKFGIPRQSGLVPGLRGEIRFRPEYRREEAFRDLEQFSHIWILWYFSETDESAEQGWRPTVRPPRLGGNRRVGVFATRSTYRPNPIALSCVRLLGIRTDPEYGPVLEIEGADLMDGTPVLDIKPYLPVSDCRPEASEGYTGQTKQYHLQVRIDDELLCRVPPDERDALLALLAQDPRPGYAEDPERIYGFRYAGMEIRFCVRDGILSVSDIIANADVESTTKYERKKKTKE